MLKSKLANDPLPPAVIERNIYLLRRQKVMLDSDLAVLYGIATKQLNRAVRRNLERFPSDFMFQLTPAEARALRFQIGTSSEGAHGGRRYLPYVFTQEGVAMLSSVLKSPRAVKVNIAIMRPLSASARSWRRTASLQQRLKRWSGVTTPISRTSSR